MSRKVLFLGCNYDQIPYLNAAKELGFRVIGTDKNHKAPGACMVDRFYNIGYNDMDKLKQVVINEELGLDDRIFTAAAHFAYEGAASAAKIAGIPYISGETVDICLDKAKFYNFLHEIGVPVPLTRTFDPLKHQYLDHSKVYYLKSDYGKSPNYCYRIANGRIPALPKDFDSYYRKLFLLQEEISGTHFRLNFYCGYVSVFLKLSDTACVPLQSLGLEHNKIINELSNVLHLLGLSNYVVKFDLIINERGWYVIDIGLDPPLRLMLLYNFLGNDFAFDYVRHYLTGERNSFSGWDEICKPVLINGSPENGFEIKRFDGS